MSAVYESERDSGRDRFLRYLVAGGVAAGVNFGSRFALSQWLPFEGAVVVAFGLGLGCGFLLMRRYVFPGADRSWAAQFASYVFVNMLALLLTVVVSSAMLRLVLPALGVELHAEAIAHGIGVAVPVVTSYFGHRSLTFR